MATYFVVAERQAAFKQDNGNGQGDDREQQVSKHDFGVQKSQQRPCGNAAGQQEQDGRHANPPGEPLAKQGEHTDTGKEKDSADGHNGVSSVEVWV